MSWRRHRVRKPKLSRVIRRLDGDETALARMVLKAQQRAAQQTELAAPPTPGPYSGTAHTQISLPKAASLTASGPGLRL